MAQVLIQEVERHQAEKICREITATLPEWFGQPEANERYAAGMLDRLSFAAINKDRYVGLITLEFHYPTNANIYWMGVKRDYHHHGIGTLLMEKAAEYSLNRGCSSITVETLSEKNSDEAYLKPYRFYERSGFKPLFEMNTYGPDFLMVYMLKNLSSSFGEVFNSDEVNIVPAELNDYPVIQNMARFYVYDMAKYCGHDSPDWACPVDGLYECMDFKSYFVEKDHYAYFVKVNDELAGFVLINKTGFSADVDWMMGQFFILSRFQGRDIAEVVAKRIWREFKGIWEVRVIPENSRALKFWRRIISEFTSGDYTEQLTFINPKEEESKRFILKFDATSK